MVLMAGALDRRRHLQGAAEAISAAGIPATFLVLPGARHGEYGPEGERVLGEALRWAFERAPPQGSGARNASPGESSRLGATPTQ